MVGTDPACWSLCIGIASWHQDNRGRAQGDAHVQVLDTRDWAVAPRKRFFIATYPPGPPLQIPRRLVPWDEGWGLRWQGEATVMMRARQRRPVIRASTFQYHPQLMLCHKDSEWVAMPLQAVCTASL